MRALHEMGLVGVIGHVGAAMDRRVQRGLAGRGLTAADALAAIARVVTAGGDAQIDITRETGLSRATISARTGWLVKLGLVTRRRDVDDHRKCRVSLTPAGDRALHDATLGRQADEDATLAPLSHEERDLLAGMLHRLEAHLVPAGA